MTRRFITVVPLVTSLLSSLGMVVFAVPPRLGPEPRLVRCADCRPDVALRAPEGRKDEGAVPRPPSAGQPVSARPRHGKDFEAQGGILGGARPAAKWFRGRLAMVRIMPRCPSVAEPSLLPPMRSSHPLCR